jgi:hypothetical protein
VLAKKVLTRLIYGIVALHALLWLLDGFPFRLALLSVASHAVYLQNLRRFPIVKLTDPVFLLSIGTFPWRPARRTLTSPKSPRPREPLPVVPLLPTPGR